jgi:hypothetical protein
LIRRQKMVDLNALRKNTLINPDSNFRVAIADEPINAKIDGKKIFCVRVDNAGSNSMMMLGFTPRETFDSTKEAFFGYNGFNGAGMNLCGGNLCYPVDKYHNIINEEISKKAKEIIVILTISNNGKYKEIRFLCDGQESKSTNASEILKGDRLFPAICLASAGQQITAIPNDEIETRTPEIEELIIQQQGYSLLRFVSVSVAKYPLLQAHEDLGKKFLQQREVLFRGLMATLQK